MEGEEPNAKRPCLEEQEHHQQPAGFAAVTSETVSSTSEPVQSSVSSVHSTSSNVILPSTSGPATSTPSPSTTSAPAAPVMETACVSSSVAVATTAGLTSLGQPTSSTDSKPHQTGLLAHSNSTMNYSVSRSLDCTGNELSLLAVNSRIDAVVSVSSTGAATSSASTVSSMPTQASAVSPTPNSTSSLACIAAQSSNVSSTPVTACDTSMPASIVGILSSDPSVQLSSTPVLVNVWEVSSTPAPVTSDSHAQLADKGNSLLPAARSSNAPIRELTACMSFSPATVCEVSSTPAAVKECAVLPTSSGAVSSTAAPGRGVSSASARSVPVSVGVSSSISARPHPLTLSTVAEAQPAPPVNLSESKVSSSSVFIPNSNATWNVLSSATDAASSTIPSPSSSQSSTGTAAADKMCPNPERFTQQKTEQHLDKTVRSASAQASDKAASVSQVSKVNSFALPSKHTVKEVKLGSSSTYSKPSTEIGHLKAPYNSEKETDGVPAASDGDAVPADQEGIAQASLPAATSPIVNMDEDSQGSGSNKEKKEVRRFRCEVVVPESTEAFTVEKVMEYVWPLEGGYGEHYFVQEHISQYIGISSFKRKYPDLRRRPIDMAERDYLKELGMVSEIACDMGLMAVRSEDVMDVLFADFPTKFEELTHIMAERRDRQLKERGKVEYQVADIDKSKLQEYGRRAAEEAARYNAALNREKKEERRYSFDLQSFTLHMPLGLGKKLPPSLTRVGHYPVAVLPGQYTDQYKRYSTTELRRLPLNSVCSGPLPGETAPEEPVVPPDDTATVSGNAAVDSKAAIAVIKTEEAPAADEKVLKCKICSRGKENNRSGKAEGLIVCAKCSSASHASCVDLNPTMIPRINSYGWQCMECKNCMQCSNSEDEDKMIFCDLCDRGYHIYCVGLKRVPHGRWHCKECAVCNTCGSRAPNGGENIKNAEWQHEFRKNRDNNKIAYATTLCVPCDRLWKRRQFCYVCLKVYRSIPEDNMIRCANCPKYIHKESGECSAVFEGEHLCIPCFRSSNTTVLNHNRIIAAAKKKMASGY